MEHYSRTNRHQQETKPDIEPQVRKTTSHHVKTGLSAFQKTVATISSLLGIILSCIAIMNYLNKKPETQTTPSSTTTTIIREIEKSNTSENEIKQTEVDTNSQTAKTTDSPTRQEDTSPSSTDISTSTVTETSNTASHTSPSSQE